MTRLFSLLVLLAGGLYAQDGLQVNQSQGPPQVAYSALIYYTGANVTYTCTALSVQASKTYTASTVSIAVLTNVATVTITAHGWQTDNTVTIAGSATSALNGSYTITQTGANTFTFATSGVADATYTDATAASTAPRSSAAIWAIEKFYYTGASPTRSAWANGIATVGSSISQTGGAICDNRATLSYQ